MKASKAEICQQLLSHYENEDEEFFQNIMTADKMWVHHYEHETKCHSITKVHLQNKKMQNPGLGRKSQGYSFWDVGGLFTQTALKMGPQSTRVVHYNPQNFETTITKSSEAQKEFAAA